MIVSGKADITDPRIPRGLFRVSSQMNDNNLVIGAIALKSQPFLPCCFSRKI